MAHKQGSPLGLHPGAVTHQGFALTALMPKLLFFLPRDTDDSQGVSIALQVAIQPQAEGAGVPSVGLDPAVALIKALGRDNHALRSQGGELAAESEAEATGFIHGMNSVSLAQEPFHPGDESLP
jgi:hypothetical protein